MRGRVKEKIEDKEEIEKWRWRMRRSNRKEEKKLIDPYSLKLFICFTSTYLNLSLIALWLRTI